MKISAYNELLALVGSEYLVDASGGANYKIRSDMAAQIHAEHSIQCVACSDFLASTLPQAPFLILDMVQLPSETNHPGIWSNTVGGTSAQVAFGGSVYIWKGGEVFESVFRIPTSVNTKEFCLGMTSGAGGSASGVYFHVDQGVVLGTVASGGILGKTVTDLPYTLVHSTWYRAWFYVLPDLSGVVFRIYDGNGNKLWEDGVLRTPSAVSTSASVLWGTAAGAGARTIDMDWLAFYQTQQLAR